MTNLPRSLEFLCVQWTQVTGTVDLGNLPKGIETIFIIENNITAIVNIVNLLASLEDIAVNEKNIQDKSIYVGKLLESQPYLDFADCEFTAILCADPADRCRICTEAYLSSTFSDMSYPSDSDTFEEDSE